MAKRGLTSVQRTLRACRDAGRFVEKVEQWLSYKRKEQYAPQGKKFVPGVRRDAFGFIDIIAIDTDSIIGIQACTQTGKKHRQAILANEYALAWLKAGGKIELWTWRKVKVVRGMKRERWDAKVENITLIDFETKLPERPF